MQLQFDWNFYPNSLITPITIGMNFYSNSNLIGILGLTHSDSFLLTFDDESSNIQI